MVQVLTSIGWRLPGACLRGLTLIELTVVLAISALLAAAAYPSWQDQLIRGRRKDAMAALSTLQLAQERHRSSYAQYAQHLSALQHPSRSPADHYELSVEHADTLGYTLVATARAGSPQTADGPCARLGLLMRSGWVQELAAARDAPLQPDTDRKCWSS